MHNFAKLIVMMAFLAFVVGCVTEETYHMAEPNDTIDARVVGHIHGVVRDGYNNALLAGVEVELTQGGNRYVQTTSSHGHYSFGNLVPGSYTLTFVYPNAEEKQVADLYAHGVNWTWIPEITDFFDPEGRHDGWTNWPYGTDRDFHYEVVNDMFLYPRTGTATGRVLRHDAEHNLVGAAGVTVVADYSHNPFLSVTQYTTETGADGRYSFDRLPVGMGLCGSGGGDKTTVVSDRYDCFNIWLRTVTYQDQASEPPTTLLAEPVPLDLEYGGPFVANHLILMPAYAPQITMRNFDEDVLFPVNGTFIAKFNMPMDQATFAAELMDVGMAKENGNEGHGTPVPLGVAFYPMPDGSLVHVSPASPLEDGWEYVLRLSGYSSVGWHPFDSTFDITTENRGEPQVVSMNFTVCGTHYDVPVDPDYAFIFHFNTPAMDPEAFMVDVLMANSANDPNPGPGIEALFSFSGNVLTVAVGALEFDQYYHIHLYGMTLQGRVFEETYCVRTEDRLPAFADPLNFLTGAECYPPACCVPVDPDFAFNVRFVDADENPVDMHSEAFVAELYTVEDCHDDYPELYLAAPWSFEDNILTVSPGALEYGQYYHLRILGMTQQGYATEDVFCVCARDLPEIEAEFNFQDLRVPFGDLTPALIVAFSMEMDPRFLEITFMHDGDHVLYDEGEDLWTEGNTVLTIRPTLPLGGPDWQYQLNVVCQNTFGDVFDSGNRFNFRTMDFQQVQVVDHNLESYFEDLGEDLWLIFSHPMDPASFLPPHNDIYLTQNGVDVEILGTPAWGTTAYGANTMMTIAHEDFWPNAEVCLQVSGLSQNGKPITVDECFETRQVEPMVVAHNLAQFVYDVNGHEMNIIHTQHQPLTFTFSDPMDENTIEFRMYRNEPDPEFTLPGTWELTPDGTQLEFTPQVHTLRHSQNYYIGISGRTIEGADLDGGLDHQNYPRKLTGHNYHTKFRTAGGFEYLWDNLVQADNTRLNVPVHVEGQPDQPWPIEIYFDVEKYGEQFDLTAEDTEVTLWRDITPDGDGDPMTPAHWEAVHIRPNTQVQWQPVPGTLQIIPNQVLELGTQYQITYELYSTLPGLSAPPGLARDFTQSGLGQLVFETISSPVQPLDPNWPTMANLRHVFMDPVWMADFDERFIPLLWEPDPNADKYYVYARVADMAKYDFIRVAEVNQMPEPQTWVDLDVLAHLFDPDLDDGCQAFFNGQDIKFIVTGWNLLGEGYPCTELTVRDTTPPMDDGDSGYPLDAQDGSAENYPGEEDATFTIQYDAREYLNHGVMPKVWISSDDGETWVEEEVTSEHVRFEDDACFTSIFVTLTVGAGENRAGEWLKLTHFEDVRGNAFFEDEDNPAHHWVLEDTTPPTGGEFEIRTANATFDMSDEPAEDREVVIRYTAIEPLDPTAPDAWIRITEAFDETGFGDGAVKLAHLQLLPAHYSEDGTYIEFTLTAPTAGGLNYSGDHLTIEGLRDTSGNDYDDDTSPVLVLPDLTEPFGEFTAIMGDPANPTPGAEEITVTFTATEILVEPEVAADWNTLGFQIWNAADPRVQQTPAQVAREYVTDSWAVVGGKSTFQVKFTVPEGEDFTLYQIRVLTNPDTGITDLAGNRSSDPVATVISGI